tara:strand:+ start:834300 stop:834677 length:378 start_codon:yes stop_codon:yes gene_type:complete
MELSTFYVNDTEEQVLQKRSFLELKGWISTLNYCVEESSMLLKIAKNNVKDRALSDLLLEMKKGSATFLGELINYRNSIDNLKECTDLSCDLFYLNRHETMREKMTKHIAVYRNLKNNLYASILK